MEVFAQSTGKQLAAIGWNPQLLFKIEMCIQEILMRMATDEQRRALSPADEGLRVAMMGLLEPADHCHLIRVMMGDVEDLGDERSTLSRMIETLNILFSVKTAPQASPTSMEKREEIAQGLTSYWSRLVDLPEAAGDFREFLTTKVREWEPEEMIEACTVITQDPEI